MSFVFANQFAIVPSTGQSAEECAKSVMETIASWIEGHRRYKGQKKFKVPIDGGVVQPIPVPGEEIKTEHESADLIHLYNIDWTYDSEDRTMLWSTLIKVACNSDLVEVSVVIRKSSTGFVIKPANLNVARPGIVDDLLDRYDCRMNGLSIKPDVLRVTREVVAEFTTGLLLNNQRRMPVVIVSPESETNKTLFRPHPLAENLMGLALVAKLADVATADELTRYLGQALSCCNGTVRLYWPDMRIDDDSFKHPLYRIGWDGCYHEFTPDVIDPYDDASNDPFDCLRYELAESDEIVEALGKNLFLRLSEIVSLRFTDGEIIKKARSECRAKTLSESEARIKELEATRCQLQETNASSETDKQIYELYAKENEELQNQLTLTRVENLELLDNLNTAQDKITTLEENWKQYQPHQGQPKQENVFTPAEEVAISKVTVALQRAGQRNKDILEIWSDALDSAEDSHYGNPGEVYMAVQAIVEIGRQRLKAIADGASMGGDLRAAFKKKGFDYSPGESESTTNKYGNERLFKDRDTGRQAHMLTHIKLGSGRVNNCLRLHFFLDDENKKVCIGHCGEHLKIVSRP